MKCIKGDLITHSIPKIIGTNAPSLITTHYGFQSNANDVTHNKVLMRLESNYINTFT